jgi:hypothetical protein
VLIDEIEACNIRTLKKEEILAKMQASIKSSEKEVKEIHDQINKEKEARIENM